MNSCGIYQRAVWQEMFKISILYINLKINNLRLNPHLTGARELIDILYDTSSAVLSVCKDLGPFN